MAVVQSSGGEIMKCAKIISSWGIYYTAGGNLTYLRFSLRNPTKVIVNLKLQTVYCRSNDVDFG